MPVSVKICGLTDVRAVQAVVDAKADFAGFVYYTPSPRHIELERAAALKTQLPSSIWTVSVLVDPNDALIERVLTLLKPDFLQLHGKETLGRIQTIRTLFPQAKIIKAFRIRTADDVAQSMAFHEAAHMLLFDAKPPELPGALPGGNGLSFDWALLKNRELMLPWFLSGGLHPGNAAEAIRATGAQYIDVSSGVESAPGVKEPSLIHEFVKAARNA